MQTVLKFFAGILSLAASRKIFIGIVAAGIAMLNEKLGLNLPIVAIATVVVLAIVLILSIAIEDAAGKKKNADDLAEAVKGLMTFIQENANVVKPYPPAAAAQPETPGTAVAGSDAG